MLRHLKIKGDALLELAAAAAGSGDVDFGIAVLHRVAIDLAADRPKSVAIFSDVDNRDERENNLNPN